MTVMNPEKPATIQDLLDMPKDGRKYELVDGRIVVSPAGMRHSKVAARIAYLIAAFIEDHPVGEVYAADVGIILPDGNLRSPDVTFVRTEKLPGGKTPESFGELVPDLAVEVLSPGDSMKQVGEKIGEFLDCGVPLVWLVDPVRETVTVYRSLSQTGQYRSGDVIAAEPVLPGFSCDVSRFFQ